MDKIDHIGYYFFNTMALFMILTTILAYNLIKENYTKSEFKTSIDIVKIFPGFFKNPNLRNFIAFGFLSRLFLAYWSTITGMVVLELGVNKDTLSEFSTLSLVVSVLFMFYIGKVNFSDNSKVYKKSYTLYYFYFLALFSNLLYLYLSKNFTMFYVNQVFLVIYSALGNLVFTSYTVFINRIVDKNASATFLSVMNSLSNIPTLMFNPLFTWSLNYGFIKPSIVILTLHGMFTFLLMPGFLKRIQNTPREQF